MKQKKILNILLSLVTVIALSACGGNENSSSVDQDKLEKIYLAKNIVFREKVNIIQAKSASADNGFFSSLSPFTQLHASDLTVDAETKIYADNVVFTPDLNSSVESTNVQDAIAEVSLVFSKIIVGVWKVENKNIDMWKDNGVYSSEGEIEIEDNGTYSIVSGSVAALSVAVNDPSTCGGYVDDSMVYEVITDDLILFKNTRSRDSYTSPPIETVAFVIPTVASLKKNKIILVKNGGTGDCGSESQQTVSILTRVLN